MFWDDLDPEKPGFQKSETTTTSATSASDSEQVTIMNLNLIITALDHYVQCSTTKDDICAEMEHLSKNLKRI